MRRYVSAYHGKGGIVAEQQQQKLFREKSLESIESPEALNEYLRVTSPGVWLVLATIAILLVGAIVWGVFGRIETTRSLAVQALDGTATCFIPSDILETVVEQGVVSIGGQSYRLRANSNVRVTVVNDDINPIVALVGNLKPGDMAVEVPLDARLTDGVYEGVVVTESLQPVTLLLR